MSIINKIKRLFDTFTGEEYNNENCTKSTPCQSCGACCSYFKINFNTKLNEHVPKSYVVKIDRKMSGIKGATSFKGTCSGFSGKIGVKCSCEIYQNRPDVCKKFPVWLKSGKQNPRCFKARVYHGLPGEID